MVRLEKQNECVKQVDSALSDVSLPTYSKMRQLLWKETKDKQRLQHSYNELVRTLTKYIDGA